MSEIRFPTSERMDKLIENICNHIGVNKTDYIKSLILKDLTERGITYKEGEN